MPKRTNLEMLTLLFPITSPCHCARNRTVNMSFVAVPDSELFCENWGQNTDDADLCPDCSEKGVLEDPLPYFFFDPETECQDGENVIFSLRMRLSLIETFNRLIQEYKDERFSGKKIHLAADSPCNCLNDFHIFRFNETQNDFANNAWRFDVFPFIEKNKVVVVDSQSVCLSCDISTKDGKDLGTVSTPIFSLDDIAEINAWLLANNYSEEKVNKRQPTIAEEQEDGVCPDCGEEIPKKTKHGDSCANCGHVFNPISEIDDAE